MALELRDAGALVAATGAFRDLSCSPASIRPPASHQSSHAQAQQAVRRAVPPTLLSLMRFSKQAGAGSDEEAYVPGARRASGSAKCRGARMAAGRRTIADVSFEILAEVRAAGTV